MRGFNLPRALVAYALGLVTLLGGPLVARAAGARVHHHRRVAKTAAHPDAARAAANPATKHSASAMPSKASVRRNHHTASGAKGPRVARRRRTVLEPKRATALAEIDRLPLEHYRHLPPLRGSHESLVRQNERAGQDGLARIEDDQMLATLTKNKELVAIPMSAGIHADQRLAENRRYCRPWTARFLADLARVHYARFHSALQINSAVRTVSYQKHLLLVNGNAAPAEGDVASPHLTGAAVDIGKKGLSISEIGWLRAYLLPLQSAGKLDVEEEFHQACFHISVYKAYVSATDGISEPAPSPHPGHRRTATLLAARVH